MMMKPARFPTLVTGPENTDLPGVDKPIEKTDVSGDMLAPALVVRVGHRNKTERQSIPP